MGPGSDSAKVEEAADTEFDVRQRVLLYRQEWVRATTLLIIFVTFFMSVGVTARNGIFVASILSICLLGLGILWESAELIVFFRRNRKRGIHPGIHVGFELLFWGGLLGAAVMWTIENINFADRGPVWSSVSAYAAALASLHSVAAVFHFTLFVWACVDVDRRRRVRYIKFIADAQSKQNPLRRASTGNELDDLPPPPPGMAYLVPMPGREGQPPIYLVPKQSANANNRAMYPHELGPSNDLVELMGSPRARELDGEGVLEADGEDSKKY